MCIYKLYQEHWEYSNELVMSGGGWFLEKYVCYLGALRTAAAGDAKLKTCQTVNWTETSIKAGKG